MTSASSDGGMDAGSLSSDNGRSPRHRAGGDQHHAATAFGDNGVGCGRRHQGRLEQLGRTEATPGGVSGGAVCAMSHNLQSNASRCNGRPMTSTTSNRKRLNLNCQYELPMFSPTLEATLHLPHHGRRLADGNAQCSRLLRPYRLQRRAPSPTGVGGGARKRVTMRALARQLVCRRAFALWVFCNYFSWFCVPNHSVG